MATAAEYLKKPYGRLLIPDEDDGGYRAEIIEFPGCFAEGDTPAEAFTNLEDAASSWLESVLAKGQTVPDPMEELDYSGKLVVRLPKSLHRRAVLAANRENVSLNQFIVTSVAEQVGMRSGTATLGPWPLQTLPSTQGVLGIIVYVQQTSKPQWSVITPTLQARQIVSVASSASGALGMPLIDLAVSGPKEHA